jgi:hypothetical protein
MFMKCPFMAVLAGGALLSCTEAPTTPHAGARVTPSSERAVILDDAQAAAITLAQLVAVNINEPRIRAAIRNGLRASPFAEHRLRVADFVRSADGHPVAEGVESKAADRGYPAMAVLLTAMGDWDIYVHREVKRREWRGGADVLVGVGWEGIDQVIAFDVDGQRADFDPRFGWPSQTVILLIPGEVLIPRVSPQPDVPGDVIQESFDGTFAAGFLTQDESGRTTVVPHDKVVQFGGGVLNMDACPPEENTCPGGGAVVVIPGVLGTKSKAFRASLRSHTTAFVTTRRCATIWNCRPRSIGPSSLTCTPRLSPVYQAKDAIRLHREATFPVSLSLGR